MVQELWASNHDWVYLCSARPRHRVAHQCHNNVNMYKYSKLAHNIPCGSRAMSILLKDLDGPKWCLEKPCNRFAYQWLDNVKINKHEAIWSKYTVRFKSYEHFTNWTQPAGLMLSKAPFIKVSKGSKIRNRYNQVPHLTQNTNRKVTNSRLDTTNESQEVSPFPSRWQPTKHI